MAKVRALKEASESFLAARLDQNRLAGLERDECLIEMDGMRARHIDRVDMIGRCHRLERIEGLDAGMFLREGHRFGRIARGDAGKRGALGPLDIAREGMCDASGGRNSPANGAAFRAHASPVRCAQSGCFRPTCRFRFGFLPSRQGSGKRTPAQALGKINRANMWMTGGTTGQPAVA